MWRLSNRRRRMAVLLMPVCALWFFGCAPVQAPRVGVGEPLLPPPPPVNTPYTQPPAPVVGSHAGVTLCPRVTVAPIGSQVVLLAGVLWPDGYLRTNARIQWVLAPTGVGQFVQVDPGTWENYLVLDFTQPRIIHEGLAVATTSRRYLRLTRGTPTPEDDVCVLRGQTWISVSSPVEGTSHVTAFSPDVFAGGGQRQSATIYWIDAQWCFPPPSVNPAGSRHVFTTVLTRQSDHAPLAGWLVRYQILDGPSAGFAPDGATTTEVPTDADGQASVEVFQPQPAPGTNRIGIQVIRPESLGGQRIVVGSGSTLKTWSAPEISVRKTGPTAASVGTTLTYRIELANPGDLPAAGVVLTDEIPEGLTYLSSQPPGQLAGRKLRWNVGQILAGATQSFEVSYRAERAGSVTACAEATAADGLRARDCVTTTIANAQVEVQIIGPERAAVGDTVTYEVVITNVGDVTATGLVVRDEFEAGFEHAEAASPIERSLGEDLAPGRSKTIGVAFRVTKAGEICHTVTVTGDGGIRASRRTCLTATAPAQPQPKLEPQPKPKPQPRPPAEPAPPTSQARVSLRVAGPVGPIRVGDLAKFDIEVVNDGPEAIRDVRVLAAFDPGLEAQKASPGNRREGNDIYWMIPTLSPREPQQFQIEFRAVQPAQQACVRARATGRDFGDVQDQQCIEIRKAPMRPAGNLAMTVADLRDPVAAGSEFTYEIRVTNMAEQADRNVTLIVNVPPTMIPVRLQTTGPSGKKYEIEGRTIRFEPVPQLFSGQTLIYRVRVQAKQSGDARLRAEVTSQNVRDPLVVEEATHVFAE